MISTIATLVADVKALVKTVDRIESRLEGLATREELKAFVPRHEFDAFKTKVESGLPKTLLDNAKNFCLALVAIAGACSMAFAAISWVAGHHG